MRSNTRNTLPIALSPEERDLLAAAARRDGLKVSTWVRQVAVERAQVRLGALMLITGGRKDKL